MLLDILAILIIALLTVFFIISLSWHVGTIMFNRYSEIQNTYLGFAALAIMVLAALAIVWAAARLTGQA